MISSVTLLVTAPLAASGSARPTAPVRRAGDCTNQLINFDDSSIVQSDPNKIEPIQNPFAGFNWDGFGVTTCPGDACTKFPADATKQFTAPRLAMAEGFIGSAQLKELNLQGAPKGKFTLADETSSFDLGTFDIFDVIDLPQALHGTLGDEEMRVHLDCTKAGSDDHVQLTIPFTRSLDTAGYSITAEQLAGADFTALSSCKVSTGQAFSVFGKFIEIPTETMGLDNLNVCVR